MFDVDYKGIPPDLKGMIDYLSPWGALCEVFLGLKGTAHVERASCGAGLLWQGQPLADSGGMHIWSMIKDASDAPRALLVAFKRCVLADLWWPRISRRGVILIRGIIDLAMTNIAQPIYEGAPYLPQSELTQNRTLRWWEGKPLDTRVVFPDLTAGEEAEYNRIIAAAKVRLEPEARVIRAAWVEQQAERNAHANGRDKPNADDYRRVENLLSGNMTLTASFALQMDDRSLGSGGIVTVRDILRDPERFVGKTLADPLDWGH